MAERPSIPTGLPPHFLPGYDEPPASRPGLGTVFSTLAAVLEILDNPALTAEHTAMFGVEEPDFRTVHPNVAAMTSAPPERHDRLRSLLQPSFTRRHIDRLRPHIVEIADRLAAELPRHADADGVVDVVEYYARRLPFELMAELVGLERATADALYRPLWHWLVDGVQTAASVRVVPEPPEAWTVWQRVVDDRRARAAAGDPGPDGVLNVLLAAQREGYSVGSRLLNDDEIIGTLMFLFTAGVASTASAIASTIVYADETGQWANVAAQEEDGSGSEAADVLTRRAVIFDPPFPIVGRVATAETTVAGCPVHAGDMVTANIMGAQRDPALVGDGDDPPPEWWALPMWGRGRLRCLGEALAIAEMVIGISRLAIRYPALAVTGLGPRPVSMVPAFLRVDVVLTVGPALPGRAT